MNENDPLGTIVMLGGLAMLSLLVWWWIWGVAL